MFIELRTPFLAGCLAWLGWRDIARQIMKKDAAILRRFSWLEIVDVFQEENLVKLFSDDFINNWSIFFLFNF